MCKRWRRSAVAALVCIVVTWLLGFESQLPPPLTTLPAREAGRRYAFATFLGANATRVNDMDDDEPDEYFTSTRQLIYHLKHSASATPYPVLVLCTPEVTATKRKRLEQDGAVVVTIDKLSSTWMKTEEPRWIDMLSKLHLFQLTAFDKICYIDADTLVLGSLEGVFEDKATQPRMTLSASESQASETLVPSSYTLAAHRDAWLYAHDLPQQGNTANSEFEYILNAGFLVIGPSRSLYDYYMTLLGAANSFNAWAMEQSLLNYVHRQEGDMPWQELNHKWNTNWPSKRDLDSGVLSFHDKFWLAEKNQDIDQHLAALWRTQRKEMLKYWQ